MHSFAGFFIFGVDFESKSPEFRRMELTGNLFRLVSYTDPNKNIFKHAFAVPWKQGLPWEQIMELNGKGANIAVHPLPYKRTTQKLNKRYGWRGGLPDRKARDFLIDCELPDRKEGEQLTPRAEMELFSKIMQLPGWFTQSILKIGNTGGGLQLHFRFARVLSQREYKGILEGFQRMFNNVPWVDPTSWNFNQCQRLIGTVNHKYGVKTYWIEQGDLEIIRGDFKPANPSHILEGLGVKIDYPGRTGSMKHVKRALKFANNAVLKAIDLAVLAVEFAKKRYTVNHDRIPEWISGVYKGLLLSGESKFTRGELKQFDNYRFWGAIKEIVVQTMTIKQLKSLKQFPKVLKLALDSNQVTIYSNQQQVGAKRKNILIGYKLGKMVGNLINSLTRKRKAKKSNNNSYDIVDLALAGLIMAKVIPPGETYESAWKRTVAYLAEIIGIIEPVEALETQSQQTKGQEREISMQKEQHNLVKSLQGLSEDRRTEGFIREMCSRLLQWVGVDDYVAASKLDPLINTLSSEQYLQYMTRGVKDSIMESITAYLVAVDERKKSDRLRDEYPHNT